MKSLLIGLTLSLLCSPSLGVMVFELPPDPAGGVGHSSWFPPDGSDNDIYSYEKFLLDSSVPITEVRWRGGYQPAGFGQLTDFTVTFMASTAPNGFYPDCGIPGEFEVYLVKYQVGGLAGQTYAGSFGGVAMYDYQYTLPQPFQATAGVTYWIRIEGETAGQPFWGVASGTGGNGSHIEYATGTTMFSNWPHDLAFSLHTNAVDPVYTITTGASPPIAGTTTGDGQYTQGSQAIVQAIPHPGYVFSNWTEFGSPVSTSPIYSFVVDADRNLVANFNLVAGSIFFDLDNAPLDAPLPIDLNVEGLGAHFWTPGSANYVVLPADASGFNPVGFDGLCIFPDTDIASDLEIDFDQRLGFASIMYAPSEVGCSDSATMRLNAFLDGVLVGTSTSTVPIPGDWPAGILSFSSTQPFNQVVIHYDSPPPTCQDWSPVFSVDNLLVTPAPAAAPVDDPQPGSGFAPTVAPNPFTGHTTVRFSMVHSGPVTVTVHDLRGRHVRTLVNGAPLEKGTQDIGWDGLDSNGHRAASGVYLCRIIANGQVQSARMSLLRGR
jgi:hypothetical protein